MDAADANTIAYALDAAWPMRVGRKLKRTLYLHDPHTNDPMQDICIGIVDSEAMAAAIIYVWNDRADLRAHVMALPMDSSPGRAYGWVHRDDVLALLDGSSDR